MKSTQNAFLLLLDWSEMSISLVAQTNLSMVLFTSLFGLDMRTMERVHANRLDRSCVVRIWVEAYACRMHSIYMMHEKEKMNYGSGRISRRRLLMHDTQATHTCTYITRMLPAMAITGRVPKQAMAVDEDMLLSGQKSYSTR
jgi:hypothetical protein